MRRALIALLLAGLALPALAEDRVQGHVALAQKLMRRGRNADARLELDAALALAPERADLLDLRASLDSPAPTAQAAGLSAGARALAAATPQATDRYARLEAPLARARTAYRDSDLKAAAAAWHEAQALDPDCAEAREGLQRLEREVYHSDADQPFDRSVAELYDAGLREMRKGRMVEARAKLEEAKALDPVQPQLLAALSWVDEGAARQQGQRDAQSLLLQGRRALADGEDAKAAAAFSQALAQAPDLAEAQAGLEGIRRRHAEAVAKDLKAGQAALAGGDTAAASLAFERALSLDPQQVQARAGLQSIQDQAQAQRSRAQARREADRLYNAGVEAWQSGDLAQAAGHFRETLAVDPQDADAKQALTVLMRKLDARADKDRHDAAGLLEEGKRLEERGALEEALKRYQRAQAKDPGLAEAASARDGLEKRLKGL